MSKLKIANKIIIYTGLSVEIYSFQHIFKNHLQTKAEQNLTRRIKKRVCVCFAHLVKEQQKFMKLSLEIDDL